MQGIRTEIVLPGDLRQCPGIFFSLEVLVAFANVLFAQTFAFIEGVDVFDHLLALIEKSGVAGQQIDELLTGHLLPLRRLTTEVDDELHDVVIIDERGVEQHKLEIELLDGVVGIWRLLLSGLEVFRQIEVDTPEGTQVVFRQQIVDGLAQFGINISVLVKLGTDALHFPETLDEGGAGGVALEVGNVFRPAIHALGLHEVLELLHGFVQLLHHHGSRVHQPDFPGPLTRLAGEQGDGIVNGFPLGAEVEDIPARLGSVEHPVGTGECLDQAMVLEILVHIEGFEVLGIEAGEQHVHHDGEVDLLLVRQVAVGVFLVLDAFLHVLIVEIKGANIEVDTVLPVVVSYDGLESIFLPVRVLLVVGLLLRQVFLQLGHILVALRGRGEDAGDVQRDEVLIRLGPPGLDLVEQVEVFDGVINGGSGQQGIKTPQIAGPVVLVEYGFHHSLPGQGLTRLDGHAIALEIVHMEAQHIAIIDGVGDGIGVQLLSEDVIGGDHASRFAFDGAIAGILFKDGCTGEAEELGPGEELADGLVVFTELGAVAFIEDEDHALVAQWFESLLVLLLVVGVQRQAKLLDGSDNDLVGVIVRQQPLYQGFGVGVLLDAFGLEAVEFLPGLAVKVLSVHHKQTFFDVRVVLEQGGGLEGGQRLAAAGGVPDIAVTAILVNAVDNGLHRVDLIRAHHHQLALALDQHHVAADHLRQGALGQKCLGEVVQVGDLFVVGRGPLIDGQEAFVGIEAEVLAGIVGKIPGVAAVADDEELHEAQQAVGVTVARIIFVIDNLLHGFARTHLQRLQLNLYQRQSVNQQNHVIALKTAFGVDAQLVDHLKAVLAPVLQVDQLIVQRRAVLALETVAPAQDPGAGEGVGADNAIQQAGKFSIGELDPVEGFEFFAEVLLQRSAVADIRAVGVFELLQSGEQALFDVVFCCHSLMPDLLLPNFFITREWSII